MALRIEPKLRRRSGQLRKEQTPFEQRLWLRLRNSQLDRFKFRRPTLIEPFICDFFCPCKGLIVEVDGDTHDAEVDARRDRKLGEKGLVVLRFTNAEVGKNIEGVLEVILLKLRAMPDRCTHPLAPPLKGKGAK